MKGLEEMCNALTVLSHEFGIEFIVVGVIYHPKDEQLEIAVGSNCTDREVRTEAIKLAVASLEGEPERIQRVH